MTINDKYLGSDVYLTDLLREAQKRKLKTPMLQKIVEAIPDDGGSEDVIVNVTEFKRELQKLGTISTCALEGLQE